jgi:hypothetical protein
VKSSSNLPKIETVRVTRQKYMIMGTAGPRTRATVLGKVSSNLPGSASQELSELLHDSRVVRQKNMVGP